MKTSSLEYSGDFGRLELSRTVNPKLAAVHPQHQTSPKATVSLGPKALKYESFEGTVRARMSNTIRPQGHAFIESVFVFCREVRDSPIESQKPLPVVCTLSLWRFRHLSYNL